ncbi:MAG TPA: hypothetical protein VGR38_01085 [Candidatus Polarisedimenticolia bacterium]|nr:hypothetical protein [Candidatus Polarisedimenticolia bacterium]
MMGVRAYLVVSGCLFGVVALAQLVRAIRHVPVALGSHSVPVALSWVAAIVTGSLSAWALRLASHGRA